MIHSDLHTTPDVDLFDYLGDNMLIPTAHGDSTPYDISLTPYLRAPLNDMDSRLYRSVIFIGPSQSGKTSGLVAGYLAQGIMRDSLSDCCVMNVSMERASDFSIRVFDKLVRCNLEIQKRVLPGRANTQSRKQLKNGVLINILHPSNTTLSGRAYQCIMLPDMERVTSVSEGSTFSLSMNRIRSFGNLGTVLAESSPSFDITGEAIDWEADHPHDAPSVGGILSLFNESTQSKLYAPCQHCGVYWAVGYDVDDLIIPDTGSHNERCSRAAVSCPECGAMNDDSHRRQMIAQSLWVARGQHIENGKVIGPKPDTDSSGYWQAGLLAGMSSFKQIASNYLKAEAKFQSTGDESDIKVCVNTDFALPYQSRVGTEQADLGELQSRAIDIEPKTVPAGCTHIIASVDIGKYDFHVCVGAMMEGYDNAMIIIDRYVLKYSDRKVEGEDEGNHELLRPGSFEEDWNVLTRHVLNGGYQVEGTDDYMIPSAIAVDTGGAENTTVHAYKWHRGLRKFGIETYNRVKLIKGGSNMKSDSKQTFIEKGGLTATITLLHVNSIKSRIDGLLKRTEPGDGYLGFTKNLTPGFYRELADSEAIDERGIWTKKGNRRTESLDLCVYLQYLSELHLLPLYTGRRGMMERKAREQRIASRQASGGSQRTFADSMGINLNV